MHLLQSRTDEAIAWFEKGRGDNPGYANMHAWLASAYALKGDVARGGAELAEARRLAEGKGFSSVAAMRAGYWGIPEIRGLFEATYFTGLRKAGMPEE